MSTTTVPRISYQDFVAARQLAQRLFIPVAEAADLLGLTATSQATAPEILLTRWRVAIVAAQAVRAAQLRARVTSRAATTAQA